MPYWRWEMLHDLLNVGYFPKELPAPFVTASLPNVLLRQGGSLPGAFGDPRTKAVICQHNLARAGSLRRQLGIVNPLPFLALCRTISANWSAIRSHCAKSNLSTTSPIQDRRGLRAVIPSGGLDDTAIKAASRGGRRYVVRADISKCYPSVYTHTIPWALHGKATSKRCRDATLFGNEIDRAARNCQDQETAGIPIGPDTSLVIAEIILSAIDSQLQQRHPDLQGIRRMDDYELYARTQRDANEYLSSLQELTGEFKFSLNPEKTDVSELPQPIQTLWQRELRAFRFPESARAQRTAIIDFFDKVFEFSSQQPNAHVVQYGLSRINRTDLDPANWDVLQSLVLQAMVREPGCFSHAYQILSEAGDLGYLPDAASLEETINETIAVHARLGHASEVAWALWLAIDFKIAIDGSACRALAVAEDDIVAILTLDANHRGLLNSFTPPKSWLSWLDTDALNGRHWLFAYEVGRRNWLPIKHDYIRKHPGFSFLKRNKVGFYGQPHRAVKPKHKSAKLRKTISAASVTKSLAFEPGIDIDDAFSIY